MKHFNHGIGGPAVGSCSLPSKSEHEDSMWADYTLDLSFLSSDDQRSALDDDDSLSNLSRDVDTTKELEEKTACSKDKLDVSCSKTTPLSEKSTTHSEPEEDSPCWIGLLSLKNLDSAAKSVTSRRSTDDLSGTYRLNPMAPHFIPSVSKQSGKRDVEEVNSPSLKKSLSSNFPSSSGEFTITDPVEDAARVENNVGENFGFIPQDMVSMTESMLDSGNEFQTTKRLDPLAPVFVPAGTKLSQGTFDTIAHSTSALNPSNNKFKVETGSGEVSRSIKIRYPVSIAEFGSTSSYNPCNESKVVITEYAKLGSSSNKPHGQRKLNPLAPQFSLADTKPKAYGYVKNQAADDLSIPSPRIGYGDDTVMEADLPQSSVYVEHLRPNLSRGNSALISFKADSNFGSFKRFGMESNTTLSVKDDMDFKHPRPFHVVETGSPSNVDAFSEYGQRHGYSASSPSPKLDVKKLLTTMHGLSELLTLANGSESSDSPNALELDLINSIIQNLNMYIRSSSQKQAGNQSVIRHSSYDLKMLPNKSKLSIRDLQLPRANNMTVDLDVKRKEKYSMVSAETVPDSRLREYVGTENDSLGQRLPTESSRHGAD